MPRPIRIFLRGDWIAADQLVTRGASGSTDANPPGVGFFASDCAILCHADHHTGGYHAPRRGVPSENIPPIQRGLFFGMATRGGINRSHGPEEENTQHPGDRLTAAGFWFRGLPGRASFGADT
jgi:hypothetical protein